MCPAFLPSLPVPSPSWQCRQDALTAVRASPYLPANTHCLFDTCWELPQRFTKRRSIDICLFFFFSCFAYFQETTATHRQYFVFCFFFFFLTEQCFPCISPQFLRCLYNLDNKVVRKCKIKISHWVRYNYLHNYPL